AQDLQLPSPRVCRVLCVFDLKLGIGRGRIYQQRDGPRRGGQLLRQVQLLCHQLRGEEVHAGNITTRPIQACNEAKSDWVRSHYKHDRNCCGRRLCHGCRNTAAAREYHVHLTLHQIGSERWQKVELSARPAVFDRDIPALHIAAFAETFMECAHKMGKRVGRLAADKADHRHRRLLRRRRERASRRAAEYGDELAPSHSITSSARASSVGGTVRPSSFAVLKLTNSSYLVGACTGRSAGFSPLRMRST